MRPAGFVPFASRRDFLSRMGGGLGTVAMAQMLAREAFA